LKFTTIANTKYVFRFHINANTSNAADFQLALNHTGTTTGTRWSHLNGTSAGVYAIIGGLSKTTANGTSIPITGNQTGDLPIIIWGYISVGATGGTLAFQWAQNTSNASSTTVYQGSFLEYQIVT
jgi:hypothetical protein